MSWSGWGTRLNVTSIVSQGLEQVSKLKEDVEKQFDQVISSSSNTAASGSKRGGTSEASHTAENDLFGGSSSSSRDDSLEKPPVFGSSVGLDGKVFQRRESVDDIGVQKPTPWADRLQLQNQQQPPYSADGKQRRPPPHIMSPDFLAKFQPESKAATGETSSVEKTSEEIVPSSVDHYDEVNDEVDQDVRTDQVDTDTDFKSKVESESETKQEQGTVLDETNANVDADATEVETANSRDGEEVSVAEKVVATEGEESPDNHIVEEILESHASPQNLDDQDAEEVDNVEEDVTPEVLDAKNAEITALKRKLQQREAQLLNTNSTVAELHDELDKTCQREVTAVERARFLTEQLELMRGEVNKLNRMAVTQRDSDIQTLQMALTEKEEKLRALLEEGQALSVKQAQYEQRLRQLRKEKNEEEESRLKLQSQFDAISSQFQDLNAKFRKTEEENKKYLTDLRKLQQEIDSTTKQLSKAELELRDSTSLIESMRAELQQLTQANAEMRDEIVLVKDANQSNKVLNAEKNELKRTIEFLHQNITDLEQESIRREEMARTEIQDLKKKWQEAVNRVDMMGQSVSEATQPLLRQINALREDQRSRQEIWKATEATLVQRIEEGNELRRQMEQDKVKRDNQIHQLETKVDTLEHELVAKIAQLTREKEKADAVVVHERELRGQMDALTIEMDELKLRLRGEVDSKQQLLAQLTATRAKMSDSVNVVEVEQAKEREAQLQHDLDWHKTELQRVKTLLTSRDALVESNDPSRRKGSNASNADGPPSLHGRSIEGVGAVGNLSPQASLLKKTLEISSDDGLLGSTSVLGMSQLQQRLRLREGENRLLKQQLAVLEVKQKQTTEEIVRLSTRNALLETNEMQFQQTQEELKQMKQHQHVLLELFGEKEEQVEELQSEVAELKAFYRKQLDTLAKQQQ